MTDPEHQPRERPVACRQCLHPTWSHDAICGRCTELAKTMPPGSLFAVGRPTRRMRQWDRDA